MSDTPDPLSPEIAAFLAPERRRPEPPAALQADVFARVAATLGFPSGPGPGGSDPSGGASPTGGHTGGGTVVAHGAAKHLVAGSLAKTLATLVVGGVIGSGVHEAYDLATDRRAERAAVVATAPPAPAPTPAPATPPAVVPEPQPPPAGVVRAEIPPAQPAHVARVELRERDRGLGAERALIEQARSALARQQSTAALSALERHAREFPQGELEEERESLQVQALVGLDRIEQARKAGARFHRRFPRSIFGAVVDEALRSIP